MVSVFSIKNLAQLATETTQTRMSPLT